MPQTLHLKDNDFIIYLELEMYYFRKYVQSNSQHPKKQKRQRGQRTYEFTIATSGDGNYFTNVYNGTSSGKTQSYEKYDISNSTPEVKNTKVRYFAQPWEVIYDASLDTCESRP